MAIQKPTLQDAKDVAKRLGFRTAWINRLSLLKESGLAPAVSVEPDIEVQDLKSLAQLLGAV